MTFVAPLVLDPDSAVAALRAFNIGSSGVLWMISIAATAIQWRSTRPSGKLFAIGFVMLVSYGMVSSIVGFVRQAEPNPSTILLSIANVWLIGAVLVLQIEYAKGVRRGGNL